MHQRIEVIELVYTPSKAYYPVDATMICYATGQLKLFLLNTLL